MTAVVVAWNGGVALDRCVDSLRQDGTADVIVVDNGSEAQEGARLRRHYGGQDGVVLRRLERNLGFAEGANVGFREALGGGAPMVVLVTQDVVVEPGALGALGAALEASPQAGVVGPVVMDSRRPGVALSRGERFALPFICVPRTVLRYRRAGSAAYEVSGLMGCLLLFSRACLEAVGGFDPAFFAYYEEVDLCLRARRQGFRLLCVPAARAHHDGMRGFRSGFTPPSAELKARNLIRLMRKLGRAVDWAMFVPTYTALVLSSAVLYGLRGRWDVVAALLRGVRAGCVGASGPPAGLAAERRG